MWNNNNNKVWMIKQREQFIHCEIMATSTSDKFLATFVYGANGYIERRSIWKDIIRISGNLENSPWVIIGDFNALRKKNEKIGRTSQ